MRKSILWVVPLVSVAAVAWPAQAADVTVHLDVDVVTAAPLAECDVSVPSGSNGLAVLDAAVAGGCIDGYTTRFNGTYVSCIEKAVDVCETPDETLNALTWLIYVDGVLSNEGATLLSFTADGHALQFSYEPWAVHAPCWFLGLCG